MGREAVCTCDWAGTVAEVKALLETNELILRGDIRRRVAFSEIKDVQVRSDSLCFKAGEQAAELVLGAALAAKWAATMTGPPVSLVRKLGITNRTVVRTIGDIQDENLASALAEATRISAKDADLIVACVDTPESLQAALQQVANQLMSAVPIWMVFAKGSGRALNESVIRSALRTSGMMDTKVASVSTKLTALRFSLRKSG